MMNLRNYTLRDLLVNCIKKGTVILRIKENTCQYNPFTIKAFVVALNFFNA
jgi:hypothetical protein